MQNVELTNLLVNFIKQLATDPQAALQFVSNPHGELVAQGITEHDLSGLDMPAIVQQACGEPGFPAEARGALQSYTSGGGGGGGQYHPPAQPVTSGPQSMEQVVQHLTYVTQVTNDNDIINEIVDQSTNINVGDDFDGDLDVDVNNANASGDGAVAVGEAEGDVTAATGDGAVAAGDDVKGAATGDGAVAAGEDIDAPVNTGVNSGVIADGDVDDTIVGDRNTQQANDVDLGDGDNDGVINFGDGHVTSINDSDIDDANIGGGTNVSDNDLDDGSAIGTGAGDVTASNEDTDITAQDSVVTTEQGGGDQDADFEPEFTVNEPVREPIRLAEQAEPAHDQVDDPADAPA